MDAVLLRRSLVAATVLATVVATVPALVGQQASAAATTNISLSGPTHGAAGACLMYKVTPTDAFGGPATDTGTVVVRLTESPNGDAQDVDFCVPGSVSSPAISPHYVNAAAAKRFYVPGLSVTDTGTATKTRTSVTDTGTGADTPDVASTTTPLDRANPIGQDTALYRYDGTTGAGTAITFGVTALVPGGAHLDVFRSGDGDETQSSGDPARSLDIAFSAGGPPGSIAAADAVTSVRATPTDSYSVQGGAAHRFGVALTNSSGDGVAGDTPQIRPTSGPNTSSFTASCTRSGNDGTSTCTYTGTNRGTDTIAIWVNQTSARTANPTLGLDPGEAGTTVTATTTAPVSAARFVDLTPPTASVAQGDSAPFTATVTDSGGVAVAVAGVGLTFSETGPGGISGGTAAAGGTSTRSATTDAGGHAAITIITGPTDAGTDNVTATIRTPSSTSCQTVGGRCSDSSTLTVTGSGGPTPTPSPSSSGPACTTAITGLPEDTVTATGLATVIVAAAKKSTVDLFAYSRPATDYSLVRTGVVNSTDGTVTFSVRPATNTRLYAQQRGCTAGSSVVLNVRTALTLAVVRTGPRSYTFSGDSVPARPGGLIVSVYRTKADGTEVLAMQSRADAQTGEWRVARRFSGTGRFGFVVRTGQDLLNAPGRSNVRSVLVY